MELLNGIDIANASFILLATFGSVSAVNFWKKQSSQANFILSIVFGIIFSFVPADLGNAIANKVKEAVVVAVTLNGAYQFLGGVAKKVGNS